MSMVSIKNFISPFTNTVHAVTIILVTVLFALFRLQGGGVSANFSKTRAPIESQIEIPSATEILNTEDSEPANLNKLIKSRPNGAEAPAANEKIGDSGTIQLSEDDDLLKQMIGQQPLVEEPAKPVKNDNKKNPTGGLAEIEKSLGMR